MTALAERTRGGNLPAEVTRFVGRRAELAEARRVLARSRLLTLTGVGGVGKTRLAVRLAADLHRSFADGAWLVELSALREPQLLPRTVADALHLPGQSAGSQVERLADHLSDKELLLVLDTCEHLIEDCARLAEVLLRTAPRLRILATSREPLDVMGEHNLVIPPLPVPCPDGGPVPDGDADEGDAVTLFADRAEAMAGFVLTPENRPAVTRLCHRLDGIPLAIELAAVRLRSMSVERLLARVDDRFRLLGTARAAQDRHRTLRAAIEWSHELCTPEERLLWARLSVFPGDFDLAAAEAVCAGPGLDAMELLDVLGRLVEKSIVLCERGAAGNGGPADDRYRMLDTIREYGAERLAEQPDAVDLRRRHRDHYLDLAEQSRAAALYGDQVGWLTRLRAENANLRVALEYSLSEPGEQAAGLHLTMTLQHYWMCLGLFGEARRWHERAREAAVVAAEGGPGAGPEAAWPEAARLDCFAAMIAVQQGEAEQARTLVAAALDSADPDLRAHAVHVLGLIALFEGDLPGAQKRLEEARAAFDAHGYRDPLALLTGPHLSTVLLLQSKDDEALALAEETVRRGQATGEQWNHSFALYARGAALWWLNRHREAVADLRACLKIKERLGDQLGITLALDLLTPDPVVRGDHEQAAMLLGATERMWRALGASLQYGPHYMERRAMSEKALRKRMPEDRFLAAKRRGTEMSIAEAIALARGAPPAPIPRHAREPLNLRERQVAALAGEGLSNRAIADRLGLGKRTVDAHVAHILTKLGLSSRAEIVAWASESPDGSVPR
ncbi:ATP-binding protein [Actinomadura kijaniata]|uniref:ATP-binding protein n=1 Tax=Actinomadura kijaniata TaxID=46161 RepID=UPI00082F64B4|nr:LuxR C-terminal-related transcriptional regulator [Actinomadura kijaniata]